MASNIFKILKYIGGDIKKPYSISSSIFQIEEKWKFEEKLPAKPMKKNKK